MGGDFILEKSNNIWMLSHVHRSKTSSDRPTVDQILNIMKI